MKIFFWLFLFTVAIILIPQSELLNRISIWNEPGVYRAEILQIRTSHQPGQAVLQAMLACCKNGPYAGKTIQLTHELIAADPSSLSYSPGDWVFIVPRQAENGTRFSITGPVRDRGLLTLMGIFIFSLLIIGGRQGLRSLISLSIICLLIFKVLLPLMAKGYNPLAVSIGIAILATTIALFLVSGFNGKTIASIIGTICGVITASLLTWYFGNAIHLTGCSDETAQLLKYTAMNINFQGMLFAGIIVGALGAITDMTMSIASAMQEIKNSNPGLGYEALVIQGLKVARDTIGTMTNTLILAYVGGAFSLLLLFISYQTSFARIINLEEIAAELVRMLAGSVGLIAAVPVTATVAAFTVGNDLSSKKPEDPA
jgi:uncharacterized membrane protein